jgi:hypothetical protein
MAEVSDWLYEKEAAAYCKCSVTAFRDMRPPAYKSGGRKVYSAADLDSCIRSLLRDRPSPKRSTGAAS